MAAAGTRGDGRAKPEWGAPPPGAKPPARKAAARSAAKPAARKATKATARKVPAGRAAPRKPAPRKAAPKARRPRTGRRLRRRYAVVYDIEGPRVRLGVAWFAVAFGALIGGPLTSAITYGGAAAVAGAQVARAWRREGAGPSPLMTAAGAGLMTAGACFGAGGAGLGMLAAVALAFVGASNDQRSRNPRIADIGWTLQCALPVGVVGLSMVLLCRLDQGSAISLLLLASAYEAGDYLIGSGSANPFEGPAAGAAGVMVITFIVSTLPISALSFGEAWLLGGAMVLLAPAGQLLASALLPAAGTPASGLRRLDSLLIAAPLWAWSVGLFAS